MSEQNIQGLVEEGAEKQLYNEQNEDKESERSMDDQLNYYNEYCRLFLTNSILAAQLAELSTEKNELIVKLNRLEIRGEDLEKGNIVSNQNEKKKRVRRSAAEIARHYRCIVKSCNKSYGSEGSLNQHLKLKHPELFNSLNKQLGSNLPVRQQNEENSSD